MKICSRLNEAKLGNLDPGTVFKWATDWEGRLMIKLAGAKWALPEPPYEVYDYDRNISCDKVTVYPAACIDSGDPA